MASGYEKHECGVKGGMWQDETKPRSLRHRIVDAACLITAMAISIAPAATAILGAFD